MYILTDAASETQAPRQTQHKHVSVISRETLRRQLFFGVLLPLHFSQMLGVAVCWELAPDVLKAMHINGAFFTSHLVLKLTHTLKKRHNWLDLFLSLVCKKILNSFQSFS